VDSNRCPKSGTSRHVIRFAKNLSIIKKIGLTIIIYVKGHNNSIMKIRSVLLQHDEGCKQVDDVI